VAEYSNQNEQKMNQAPHTPTEDFIEEYKRACSRERDILWMKHRRLRRIFDEIEKNTNSKGILFR
jgi:hypothetical protein